VAIYGQKPNTHFYIFTFCVYNAIASAIAISVKRNCALDHFVMLMTFATLNATQLLTNLAFSYVGIWRDDDAENATLLTR
jgi:hypothetical protein